MKSQLTLPERIEFVLTTKLFRPSNWVLREIGNLLKIIRSCRVTLGIVNGIPFVDVSKLLQSFQTVPACSIRSKS